MNIPNALTALRLALTPFVVWRFLAGDCRGAFTLLLIAGFSDAIDGLSPAVWNQVTRAGAYLDPIADKLLLVSVYVSLGIVHVVPRWLVWLVVGRDVVILSMAGIGLLFTGHRNYPALRLGQTEHRDPDLHGAGGSGRLRGRLFPADVPRLADGGGDGVERSCTTSASGIRLLAVD